MQNEWCSFRCATFLFSKKAFFEINPLTERKGRQQGGSHMSAFYLLISKFGDRFCDKGKESVAFNGVWKVFFG